MTIPAIPASKQTSFESPHVTMWFEGGVLCCSYAVDLHLTLEVAKSVVEARIFLSKGKPYPLLIDMTGLNGTTGAARKYMATMGSTLVTAGALITSSPVSKAIGNLFLRIDLPPVPTRLFTNEQKARVWLKQYL